MKIQTSLISRGSLLGRRDFLTKTLGATGGLLLTRQGVMAGPFDAASFSKAIPAEKKLDPKWLASLTRRGEPRRYSGDDLKFIGMPCGGIGAGQVYLSGDGRLWRWDVFNRFIETRGESYLKPYNAETDFRQGFFLRAGEGEAAKARALHAGGFSKVEFLGEYPMASVSFADPGCPLVVSLRAFSPFIPLCEDDSSFPLTVMQYTVKNPTEKAQRATIGGFMENAVCASVNDKALGKRTARARKSGGRVSVEFGFDPVPGVTADAKDVVFPHPQREKMAGWKKENNAGKELLVSPEFMIAKPYIRIISNGITDLEKSGVALVIDGRRVRILSSEDQKRASPGGWDVREFSGKTARLEIYGQGNDRVNVHEIAFSDLPPQQLPVRELGDFGTMALSLLGEGGFASAKLSSPEAVLDGAGALNADAEAGSNLLGGVGVAFDLAPGEEKTVTFLVSWFFPNYWPRLGQLHRYPALRRSPLQRAWYAGRWNSADEVAAHVAKEFERLDRETRLWAKTWYDSTLPWWFVDRTCLNISILATNTVLRLADGRIYGFEGVGCCPGTCIHVWHYAQAVGRIFPGLERQLREVVEFGVSMLPSGMIARRAIEGPLGGDAVDGQAGTILRAYREHQMSADDAFLRRIWPKVKRAMNTLTNRFDKDRNGLMTGAQHNTLDADWHGEVPWLSGLYVAALLATAAMARELGEEGYAKECERIAEAGKQNLVKELWDAEKGYFIMKRNPKAPRAPGVYGGSHIDQVFGQQWAMQLGLPRVFPEKETRIALESIWKYNFTPDVGAFRKSYKGGRWFAAEGDGGTVMCAFPFGPPPGVNLGVNGPGGGYFNECMSGFEWQVAAHMIHEGMVEKGLVLSRVIDDRYHPARRNPYNEIECGDHYARAMASHGAYVALSGYFHHGPRGEIGFAPRLTPGDFRCAFTAAEGWGTFSQKIKGGALDAELALRWGKLRLRKLSIGLPANGKLTTVAVSLAGRQVPAILSINDGRAEIQFSEALALSKGQDLSIMLS
jgi:uncharacterized protein (DUF608 family)